MRKKKVKHTVGFNYIDKRLFNKRIGSDLVFRVKVVPDWMKAFITGTYFYINVKTGQQCTFYDEIL
jgi:hypothetical protein